MTKGEFITACSCIFRDHTQGTIDTFDKLSELYDEMARQDTNESQATDA